ncbi:transposase [Ulvibacter litoralis]|nr:transposase [Ulvibacter litoralis]
MNQSNKCALRCRITFLKKRKEFSTGLFINPDYWDGKKQRVKPSDQSEYLNSQLSLINQNLNQAFLFLQVKGTSFNVLDIYNQYKGEAPKDELCVMEVYNLHSDRIKRLIGIDIKLVTYQKYLESGKHLQDFIMHKFKTKDILLKALKSNFLGEYEYYLKTEKKLAQSTLNKAIQRFKKVLKFAIAEEYLNRDPFLLFSYKTVRKEIIFLSEEELRRLERYQFRIDRIGMIRDLFVFCCYTGLAYKEMASLKKSDIIKEFDDNLWLSIRRSKTGKTYKVPLLPQALLILYRYDKDHSEYIFNNISNQRFNSYLKEIADFVGIKKNLTHHMARKTFASTVLLYNDVPMEIVSELLGHSSMKITQASYGKVVQKRVSEEMIKLKLK